MKIWGFALRIIWPILYIFWAVITHHTSYIKTPFENNLCWKKLVLKVPSNFDIFRYKPQHQNILNAVTEAQLGLVLKVTIQYRKTQNDDVGFFSRKHWRSGVESQAEGPSREPLELKKRKDEERKNGEIMKVLHHRIPNPYYIATEKSTTIHYLPWGAV